MTAPDSSTQGMRPLHQLARSAAQRTRLVVLGEPELSRHGLRLILKSYTNDLDVSDDEQLDRRMTEKVDVVVLTLPADASAALALVSEITATLPDTPLLAHTSLPDPASWTRIMSGGARGVIGPSTGIDLMLAAVRLVAAGGVYVPPELISQTIRRTHTELITDASVPGIGIDIDIDLTQREHAVLKLIGCSCSNGEIAAQLRITEATVRVHIRNLRQKLRARSRVDLALLAARSSR